MNQLNADAKKEMSKIGHFEGVGGQVNLETNEKRREGGGWVTAPFIFGCDAAERLASQGARTNLITFLTLQMHFTNSGGATALNNFATAGSLMPLVGAFVADAYWGRFTTIAIGCLICLLGFVTLTTIAMDHSLTPAPCTVQQANAGACQMASRLQLGVLYLALILQAVGTGGIRPCVTPFGASQFDQSNPEEMKQLKHYFNWYYVAMSISSLLAATVIVYIQDNVGWGLGFGILAIIFLVSIIFFFGGTPLYRYSPPRGSPFTRMAQVIVAAIRKRKLAVPDDPSKLYHSRAKAYELRVLGSTDSTDESEELEKPSSDDDEGDENFAKRNHGRNDANLTDKRKVTPGGAPAQVPDALAPDGVPDHEGKLKFDAKASNADLSNVKKMADESPAKKTDENFEVREPALAVGPYGKEKDEDGVIVLRHCNQFRFFDKAAIAVAQDWSDVQGKEGKILKARMNPWTLCPVQQVEELKCIVRLIPMWVTVIPTVFSMTMGHTYAVLVWYSSVYLASDRYAWLYMQDNIPFQTAQTMDGHLGKFVVPAASWSVISTITLLLWLPFYDRIITPFLRRCTGYETGITFVQKIGVGFIFSILTDLVRTLVEHKRRETAVRHGLTRPRDALPISAWWLAPQYVLGGLSESFMMVGHMEFFYYMLPEHMTSTGSALFMTAIAIGTILSTVVLNLIKKVTKKHGHGGWLVENINEAHFDYFYALVTVVTALDYVLFLLVARWFRRQRHVKQMMLQFS